MQFPYVHVCTYWLKINFYTMVTLSKWVLALKSAAIDLTLEKNSKRNRVDQDGIDVRGMAVWFKQRDLGGCGSLLQDYIHGLVKAAPSPDGTGPTWRQQSSAGCTLAALTLWRPLRPPDKLRFSRAPRTVERLCCDSRTVPRPDAAQQKAASGTRAARDASRTGHPRPNSGRSVLDLAAPRRIFSFFSSRASCIGHEYIRTRDPS